jgi:hypothetical protein
MLGLYRVVLKGKCERRSVIWVVNGRGIFWIRGDGRVGGAGFIDP